MRRLFKKLHLINVDNLIIFVLILFWLITAIFLYIIDIKLPILIIFFLFLICFVLLYLFFRIDKIFFYPIFLVFFIPMISYFFLPLLYSLFNGIKITFGYFFSYFSIAVYYCIFLLSYNFVIINQKFRNNYLTLYLNIEDKFFFKETSLILFSIFGALLFYLPIFFTIFANISSFREIYEKTRVGYGIYYYFSSFLFLFSYVLLNFRIKYSKFKIIILILYEFLAFFYGSKSINLIILIVYLLYEYLNELKRLSFLFFIKSIVLISLINLLAFSIYHKVKFHTNQNFNTTLKHLKGQNKDINIVNTEKLKFIYGYSDYIRNSAFLIDNYNSYFDNFFYGKLLLEDHIYSRIPRVFFHDKPLDFGSFKLSKEIYPQRHFLHKGDPSFGLVGRPFADFGFFASLYLLIIAFIKGYLLGFLVKNYFLVKHYEIKVPIFIAILYLLGYPIFNIGGVDPFIENLIIIPLFWSTILCIKKYL